MRAVRPADERQRLSSAENLISLSRLFLAPLVWRVRRHRAALVGVAAAAGLSDLLDGYVARHANRPRPRRPIGVWLDPLCDKVFVTSLLGLAWSERRPRAGLVAAVLTREILLAPAFLAKWTLPALRRARLDYHAAPIGKLTTVLQAATLTAWLLNLPHAAVPATLAGVSGALAAAYYVRRGLDDLAAAARACAPAVPMQTLSS